MNDLMFKHNQKGQVLLIVLLVSLIALIITAGIVARVARLSKTTVETEEHEAAFSTSEKYARRILEKVKVSGSLTNAQLQGLIEGDDVELIREDSSVIEGVTLSGNQTYQLNPDGGGSLSISLNGFSSDLLFTVVFYDGLNYSLQKRLIKANCASSTGDLSGVGCSGNTISYTVPANAQSIRLRALTGNLQFSISGSSSIADKYIITSNQKLDESSGVKSETVLYIPKGKTMPTLFDFMFFNGSGAVTKS